MTPDKPENPAPESALPEPGADTKREPQAPDSDTPEEIGGPKGAEPTRFGDWERNGRCSDF